MREQIIEKYKRVFTQAKPGTEAWLEQIKVISEQEYVSFTIQPAGKRPRAIQAPCDEMKASQQEMLEELYKFPLHPKVFGVKGTSYVDNARLHIGAQNIFKIDIEKFYPCCTLRQVLNNVTDKKLIRYIINNSYFIFWADENEEDPQGPCLPTGSPISPILANLILKDMDYALDAIAQKYGAIYSRYLDDMTFSFTSELSEEQKDKYLIKIAEQITSRGWHINLRKTGWLNPDNQAIVVTGVDIRTTPKITGRYIREKLRPALDHEARRLIRFDFHYGYLPKIAKATNVYGLIYSMQAITRGELSYVRQVNEEQFQELLKYFHKRLNRHAQNYDLIHTRDLIMSVFRECSNVKPLYMSSLVDEAERHYNELASAADLPKKMKVNIAVARVLEAYRKRTNKKRTK